MRLDRILNADTAMVDTAMASMLNLLSVLVIGAVFGVSTLGEYSLVLIYSSFIYLFSYNFIIIPATSVDWQISNFEFAQKITVISLIAFVPLSLLILVADKFVLKFSDQDIFLSLLYIISHNAFLTLRRIVLHLNISKYPTLIPLVALFIISILAALHIISYQWFILLYSLSFIVAIAVIVLKNPGSGLLLDVRLAIQFLQFSRWMALGIWFQWLSGNLVQLLVQYHNGTDALGALRILLSSFGFLSIYFQYQEIVVAREHRNETNPRFTLKSVIEGHNYLIPGILIFLCIPLYIAYCHIVGILPNLKVAFVYALYQLLVLISIIMRVYLRLMNDLLYSSIGYFAMVMAILTVEIIYRNSFNMMTAALMYFVSISFMVITLAIGLTNVSKGENTVQ